MVIRIYVCVSVCGKRVVYNVDLFCVENLEGGREN